MSWLAPRTGTAGSPQEPAPDALPGPVAEVPEAILATIPGLDLALGQSRLRGDAGRYLRFLGLFAETHGGDVAAISAASAAGDRARLGRLAHTLKGSAGTLGATRVSEAANRLVAALRAGVGDGEAADLADELTEALGELVEAIERLPGTDGGRPGD